MPLFDPPPLNRAVRGHALGETDPTVTPSSNDLFWTAARRGTEQSLGLGADYAGTLAESAGKDELAKNLYGYADKKMEVAGRLQRGPQTLGDVRGVGSAFDYGINKFGESAAVSATAAGAGVLTAGASVPIQGAAAATATFPVMAGETSYDMRHDEDSTATIGDRALASTGAGAVNAALEVLPELGVLNKLIGRGKASPAKSMAEAVVDGSKVALGAAGKESLTEVAQTAVSRGVQSIYNPDIAVSPTDPEARGEYLEAAAAGAAGGLGYGVPAGVAHASLGTASALSSGTADTAGTAADGVGQARDKVAASSAKLRAKVGSLLTPGGVPAETLSLPMDEQVDAEMSREQAYEEQMDMLRGLLVERTDLSQEETDILNQETDLDPDAQEQVRDLYELKNREDAAGAGLDRLQPQGGQASRINPNVPFEEVDAVVANAAVENEAQSPVVRSWIVAARQHLEAGEPLTSAMMNDALSIFGERGYSVLRAIAPENAQVQAAVDADQRQNGSMDTFLSQALRPEYRDTITPAQLRQLRGMINEALNDGVGDVDEILSTAFSNPQEVLDALSVYNRAELDAESGVTEAATDAEVETDATADEAEFGETQSIADEDSRLFGDVSGNQRLVIGGLSLPHPYDPAIMSEKIKANAAKLSPEGNHVEVAAHSELLRLGIDPVAAAKQLGISETELRKRVFLRDTSATPATPSVGKEFLIALKKRTIEQLNNDPNNPSSGAYLGFTNEQGALFAMDMRSYINSKVFGKRTPEALIEAMSEGVASMLVDGYSLTDGLPDSLVLARYDRSGKETSVTVKDAQSRLSKAQRFNKSRGFPFKAEDFGALADAGIQPSIDHSSGEVFLSEDAAVELIERYAAATAYRNATAKKTKVPKWTQALVDKHGVEFPSALGKVTQRGSFMSDLVGWARGEHLNSKALDALNPNKLAVADNKLAREQREKEQAQREREGPAAIGGISEDRASDIAATFGVQELDADILPTQLAESAGVDTERRDAPAAKVSKRRSKEEQKAADVLAGKKPDIKRQSFLDLMRRADHLVQNMQWGGAELPPGVDLRGKYAVLGKLAAAGEPLSYASAANREAVAKTDVASTKKLLDAYERRGFRGRSAKPMRVEVEGNIYSDSVTSKLLGPTGDAPVHMVLTIGETPTSRMAARLGIPVIDLTNPVQQKIAGDILRSYDRGRRQQVQNSKMSAEQKKAMLKGEERAGIERVRDIVNARLSQRIDSGFLNGGDMQALQTLANIVHGADNDFFEAAIEGRSMNTLLANINDLESVFKAYQKEQGKASRVDPGTTQQAHAMEFDAAVGHIDKVLPLDVRVAISSLPGMSGFYSETEITDPSGLQFTDRLIEISMYTSDPMSVAFHESMHALLRIMGEQPEQAPFIKALTKAANAPLVKSQLRALLKDHPAAIDQINKDSEERIAYMYQFWASGQLTMAASVENWFTKLTQLLMNVFGMQSNVDKATAYMEAFNSGKLKDPSAVNEVVMNSLSGPERAVRASPFIQKVNKFAEKVVLTSHGRLKSYGNPHLDNIADAFFNEASSGYLQTTRSVVTMYGSQLGAILKDLNQQQAAELAAAMHSNIIPKDAELGAKYNQMNALLRRLHAYSKNAGIDVGKVKDYFPQAWDKALITDNRADFEAMLVANAQSKDENGKLSAITPDSAEAIADLLIFGKEKLDITEDLAGYSPFMEAENERKIVISDRAVAAEFMDQDIVRVMTRYITQAAKRGEYARHFGPKGENLERWLVQAMASGVTQEEVRTDISTAIKAMEGTLGHDIDPTARAVMSGLVTWQNLAVLPLAVFSSLVDPIGISVRGGTIEQSWTAFKNAVKNIPSSLRANGKISDTQKFAELVGTVESQMTMDMLGDMYGSAFMSDWARKTNNLLFRYNLMEGWNTAIRSTATIAAIDFIERHADGENKKNSERWLSELGLSANTIVRDGYGTLLWSQKDIAAHLLATGGDVTTALEKSRMTREAINRWVDGAVLRPHAAHRPAWASDPRFMLVWHLKQFTYSFQNTIIARTMHEVRNGNYAPLMSLVAYVPFMIAADYMRSLVQGAGDEPDWRKGMSFNEILWEGTQRAGLLGVRQLAMDGADNPFFALGPTAGYMWKAADKTLDGDLTDAIVAGLPGNVLWKGW